MKKFNFVDVPTPLQRLNFKVGDTTVYMKRDDLIGFGGGGNKVRIFEYIAADIMQKNADKIITFGSIHSNHVRVAAVVANYLNIACDLIILCDDSDDDSGISTKFFTPNLKIVNYCKNVHIECCPTDKAHDFIDEYLDKQSRLGISYYWIPGGGHVPLAVHGYEDAVREILSQYSSIVCNTIDSLDAIFVPCGTGTTQAGLIAGIGNKTPVYGITVARDVNRCQKEIADLLYHVDIKFTKEDIHILPSPIKYGEKNTDVESIISTLAKSDGLFLDPIYNAKSFLAMMYFLGTHPKLKNAVYVNTGGFPNIFA